MADEQKISVASQRAVCGIHDKMRHEIHQIVEKKPWSSEKKEEFEAKLLELYKDSVEEIVKGNVSIGGQDWDCVSLSDAPNNCNDKEDMELLNRERLLQVSEMCSELEDLIRGTTSKRKKYPLSISERIRKALQCQKEILETYHPMIKSDSSLGVASTMEPDFDQCIQRLQATSFEVAQLSKSFPDLHSKADRLWQAVQSHKAMQKSDTDAVLFAKEHKRSKMSSTSVESSQAHNNQTIQTPVPREVWWGLPKRKSNPPTRFDASTNTYCW